MCEFFLIFERKDFYVLYFILVVISIESLPTLASIRKHINIIILDTYYCYIQFPTINCVVLYDLFVKLIFFMLMCFG